MSKGVLAAVFLALSFGALAQEFPTQAVRIIVPYPPGGQIDGNARFIADKLSQAWGKPVIVESKGGAQSILGAQEVARSASDGYTLMMTNGATTTIVPHLFSKVPFDPLGDFTPITQVARSATVLLAPTSAPFDTFPEMIAYARKNPGKLNFGVVSGSMHVQGELMKRGTGIDFAFIPYRGSADAGQALMSGEIQLAWDTTFSALGKLASKRVKALAVTGPERVAELPDIPTASELGIKGLEARGWMGFFAPKNLPPHLVQKLNEDIVRVVQSADFRNVLIKGANIPVGNSSEEFSAIVNREYQFWG